MGQSSSSGSELSGGDDDVVLLGFRSRPGGLANPGGAARPGGAAGTGSTSVFGFSEELFELSDLEDFTILDPVRERNRHENTAYMRRKGDSYKQRPCWRERDSLQRAHLLLWSCSMQPCPELSYMLQTNVVQQIKENEPTVTVGSGFGFPKTATGSGRQTVSSLWIDSGTSHHEVAGYG